MNLLEEQILLFELDEENEVFKEIEDDDAPLGNIFDSSSIIVVVDPLLKVIWVWEGKEASIRKKFITTQKVPSIRDKYGIDFKTKTIDEGDEPLEFKEILGL